MSTSQLRLIAYGGSVSDPAWLRSMGFDEVGVVTDWGSPPSPSAIKGAGIPYAGWNPFNDAGRDPGSAGDPYAGGIQAAKNSGWDIIAGEGSSGDIIRVVMNILPYTNYGGIVGEQQYDMYSSPWNHPASGPHTHQDYIEIYDNNKNLTVNSCIASMRAAENNGSAELGILTGDWMAAQGVTSSTLSSIIEQARNAGLRCNNVCWWVGKGYDITPALKGSCNEQLTGLISRYGIRHGIGGGGGGGGGATTYTCPDGKVVATKADCPTPAQDYGGSTPAACSPSGSELLVFVRGTSGQLYLKANSGGTWGNWTDIGGIAGGGTGPGAASAGDGSYHVFVGGGGGTVYHKGGTGGKFGAWDNVGGVTTSDCGAGSDGSGNVYVFVRGSDGKLWHRDFYSGKFHAWASLGGQLLPGTGPAVTSTGKGNLEVFVTGTNGAIYHIRIVGGKWGGWENLGGSTSATPGACALGSSELAVFVRGGDGALYYRAFGGGAWSNWSKIGGVLAGGTGPGVCKLGGKYHVFVAGTAGAVWHIAGPSWGGWENIGGQVTVPTTPGGGGGGTTPGTNTGTVPAGSHISVSFAESNATTYTAPINTKVTINIQAGYVDSKGNWIANKPYTGQLWAWSQDYSSAGKAGASHDLGKFYPDKNGHYTLSITSTVVEEIHYNVGFVAGATIHGGTQGKLISPEVPAKAGYYTYSGGGGGTPCSSTLVTMANCEYCAALEGALNGRGIHYNVIDINTNNYGFGATPGVILCNSGEKIGGRAGQFRINGAQTQALVDAIVADRNASIAKGGTKTSTWHPGTPAIPAKYGPTTGGTLEPGVWAHEIIMNWSAATSDTPTDNPTDTGTGTGQKQPISQTPTTYQSPDVQLTPVLPIPAAISLGVTVVLRDHKKAGSRMR